MIQAVGRGMETKYVKKVTEELKTNDELKNKIEVIKKKINPS